MTREAEFLRTVILPACDWLSPRIGRAAGTNKALVLMLAIAIQESGLVHRRQRGENGKPLNGLARGWWQFELRGGVTGVMRHLETSGLASSACKASYVPFVNRDVHQAIAWHDWLAGVFARLLLWSDPKPLPEVGQEDAAWAYYKGLWRPGKPSRNFWRDAYPKAIRTVTGGPTA